MGRRTIAVHVGETWLEPEELCYPNGGMTRKAYAICEDGQKRIVTCGIPDTYFSIPAFRIIRGKRVKGYVSSDETGFHFKAYKGSMRCTELRSVLLGAESHA